MLNNKKEKDHIIVSIRTCCTFAIYVNPKNQLIYTKCIRYIDLQSSIKLTVWYDVACFVMKVDLALTASIEPSELHSKVCSQDYTRSLIFIVLILSFFETS